jgi:hypothetical protein
MKKHFVSLCFILNNSINLFAQDSIVVFQEKAAMFSNKYVFYNNGTFKHYFMTDDGQIRYGVGTYKDLGCTRTLYFGEKDSLLKSELTLIYETNFKRKLVKRGNKFKSKDYYSTSRKQRVTFSQRIN